MLNKIILNFALFTDVDFILLIYLKYDKINEGSRKN